MNRALLRKVKLTENYEPPEYNDEYPVWNTGVDVPLTWENTELKRLGKQTLRLNLKSGALDKRLYKRLLRDLISTYVSNR